MNVGANTAIQIIFFMKSDASANLRIQGVPVIIVKIFSGGIPIGDL